MLYNNYLKTLSDRLDALLGQIAVEHNFDLGDEYEVAICKLLKDVLPRRFGVCRGFAVTAQGDFAGDDIIVYDQDRFPTLRLLPQEDFSLKQQIPVEAVCAYIEAKHTVVLEGTGGQSIHKACAQVAAVKRLVREPVRRDAPDPYMRPYEEFERAMRKLAEESRRSPFGISTPGVFTARPEQEKADFHLDPLSGWPEIRNPIFGGIVSRRVRIKEGGEIVEDAAAVRNCLMEATLPERPWPDLVVAGKDTILLPATEQFGETGYVCPFLVEPVGTLQPWQSRGLAFAIGVCSLLFALDFVRLGVMPWLQILADGLGVSIKQENTQP